MNMASGGLQTRLRLWCLRGEKKHQEQRPESCGALSAFLIHSFFSFLSEGRKLKVEKRLKAGDGRKKLCSVPWEAGAANPGEVPGGSARPPAVNAAVTANCNGVMQ